MSEFVRIKIDMNREAPNQTWPRSTLQIETRGKTNRESVGEKKRKHLISYS